MRDKLTILNKRLKEVHKKFLELKKCGIDEEILIIYLHDKTGIPKKKVRDFLEHFEEFHRKLVSDMAVDEL